MNLNDAIKAIESTSGFTDETTLVGEAWAIVLASLSPAPAPTPATQPSQHPIPSAILAHPGSRWGAETPPTIPAPVSLPAAPWPELPKDPPVSGNWGDWWRWGYEKGWDAARAELQRQREGQGLPAPEPPAAPTLPHISDDLMRSLVCDILDILTKATDKALGGGYFSPIPEIRARLMEVLQFAAQEAESPAP